MSPSAESSYSHRQGGQQSMGSQASLDMGASPGSRTYDEEGERALREKHAQLCTEKCRLLSKLEASTAEVRAVQNEVHRLLDFIAELVPDRVFESEDELDCEGHHDWLEETEEDQIKLQQRRESLKVAQLRHQFREIKGIKPTVAAPKPPKVAMSISRKRSIDAFVTRRIKPSRFRRNYKHLPMLSNGEVDLPVILGRGTHRIVLLQVGTVTAEAAFLRGEYIFPPGFKCKRKYFTFDANPTKEKTGKVYYVCSLRRANDRPLFEISTEVCGESLDDEDEMDRNDIEESVNASTNEEILDSDVSLAVLWKRFQNRFQDQVRARLDRDFPAAESFFGFEHDSLTKYLREALGGLP